MTWKKVEPGACNWKPGQKMIYTDDVIIGVCQDTVTGLFLLHPDGTPNFGAQVIHITAWKPLPVLPGAEYEFTLRADGFVDFGEWPVCGDSDWKEIIVNGWTFIRRSHLEEMERLAHALNAPPG